MPRFIAFLRAINVGGHIVKMDDLRSMFQSMGFKSVETFIASGNVIFDSKSQNTKSLEEQIENHLEKELGYQVATFIRNPSEITAISRQNPFSEPEIAEAVALNIALMKEPLNETTLTTLLALKTDVDNFQAIGREVYWLCRKKQSESKFSNAVFEKTLRIKATFRGLSTISKLAAKYGKNE